MSKRDEYLSSIRYQLSVLEVEARLNLKVNRQGVNISAEDILSGLLNLLRDWNLRNANADGQNFPAIDLADWDEGVVVQVSSDTSAEKIRETLKKLKNPEFEGKEIDRLVMMFLKPKLKYTTVFDHDGFGLEILDFDDLSSAMEHKSIAKLKEISAYLDEEVGKLTDTASRKPAHRLPGVPAPSASFVEGSRDRELEDLKKMISPDAPVFLCGVGGIGKTELAIQLAKQAAPEGAYFLHYYDMPGEGAALRETILRADFTDYTYQKADTENRDQEYKERMDILGTEYPGALLVIDNFDCAGKTIAEQMAEPAYRELTAKGIRLVFTTRSRVHGGYEIKPLNEEHLLKLMRDNLDGTEVSDEDLRQLIETVDGHTLMAVLMARTLAESWGDVTAENMLDALRRSDLNRADFPEVVSDQNQSYEQRQIYAHMSTLFDLSRVKENEAECAVLRCATLLPEDGMGDRLFKSCLPREQHQTLRNLANRGLLWHESGRLTIHPVIREVCREELKPTDENCGGFLDSLWQHFDLEREYDAPVFLQVAKCFSIAAEMLADTQRIWHHHAGRFWMTVGRYQAAYRYRRAVVEYYECCHAADQLRLAVACREFGSTCSHMGEIKKGLDYQRKAFSILQKIQPPPYEELAQVHYSMGFAYSDHGDHRQALEHKRRAVDIREKYLSGDRLKLARAYNNLGSTYGKLEDHQKALHYKELALKIRQEELPPHHPDLATSYSNVGVTYSRVGKLNKALEYHMKAWSIREASLLDTHLHKALSYYHIGDIYEKKKEYALALQYFRGELEIQERLMPENHPAIKKSKRRIGKLQRHIEKMNAEPDKRSDGG